MGTSSMLHVRINEETKLKAKETLESMGLSVSDAVRLFLHRVVAEQAFPLELKVPNTKTIIAMEESRTMMTAHNARFASVDELVNDIEKNK